jgi:choline dehydrogenase-like flavoprotein
MEGGRAVGVEGTLLGEDRQPVGSIVVDADVVVVSGGSIETPHLLLRSAVDDPSGQLGRNLYLHPGTPMVGHFKGERVASYEGIKQGWYIGEFSGPIHGHEVDALIEGVAGPPGMASTLFAGIGEARQEIFRHFDEYGVAGVLLRDHTPGRVTAGNGRPKIEWALSPGDAWRMRMAMQYGAEAFLAAGAQVALTGHTPTVILRGPRDFARLDAAGWGPGQINVFSFHQMGTCRMGHSRDRDVVDPAGRLWAYPNLYVADASVFPSASGVNPQITVYGFADVISDAILTTI